jgi:hypothetical protein
MVFSLCNGGPAGWVHPETEQTPNSRHRPREILGTGAAMTPRHAFGTTSQPGMSGAAMIGSFVMIANRDGAAHATGDSRWR